MRRWSSNQKASAFRSHFSSRILSRIASVRILVLGAFLAALTVGVGMALTGGAEEVRAQDAVTVLESTIRVGQSSISEDVVGYSHFTGTFEGDFHVASIFGSIEESRFE